MGEHKMANKFSKLDIDKSKISDWIKHWCELNLDGDSSIRYSDIGQRIQYAIINNDKTIKIDFIKCSGDLLTISR